MALTQHLIKSGENRDSTQFFYMMILSSETISENNREYKHFCAARGQDSFWECTRTYLLTSKKP